MNEFSIKPMIASYPTVQIHQTMKIFQLHYKTVISIYLIAIMPFSLWAQLHVNAYAQVTNITNTTVTLSNVNETYDTYEDGEQVLIWQVQDDVLGTNINNTINFGTIGNIANAGSIERATILSHTETSGVPTTLTFSQPLQNNYNIGPNSRVQIISFPELGTPNYTSTADITGLAWDGNTGGVVAFQVSGVLTLQHNITADFLGFRGGARSRNVNQAACRPTPYISNSNQYGEKGEGIYLATNTNHRFARGKLANGGGGGNHHNAGGGGGGNFTAGGEGGHGWNNGRGQCPLGTGAGGFGGEALSSYISANRLFLGGGGGGGQQNENVGREGGRGGGLVYIQSTTLVSSGTCSGINITAHGASSRNGGNDGIGGGGAGGSILLDVSQFMIGNNCPLIVTANGGDGGRVGNINTHGGGAGGGQGVVIYSVPIPSNVTTTTLNGTGGCNNSSNPCNNRADSGSGANNTGIIAGILLPLALTHFEGNLTPKSTVDLQWSIDQIVGHPEMTLEHSHDAIHFEDLYSIAIHSQSGPTTPYQYTDLTPFPGDNYYRLRWKDSNGDDTYSNIITVYVPSQQPTIIIAPNPADNHIQIITRFQNTIPECALFDAIGRQIVLPVQAGPQLTTLDTSTLPKGIYVLRVRLGVTVKTQRIILY